MLHLDLHSYKMSSEVCSFFETTLKEVNSNNLQPLQFWTESFATLFHLSLLHRICPSQAPLNLLFHFTKREHSDRF
jgi:hypothetical protein